MEDFIHVFSLYPCGVGAQGNTYTATISDLLCVPISFCSHFRFIHQISLEITSRYI
jgi:hypothetical protein